MLRERDYHRNENGLYLPGDDPLEQRRHGILRPDAKRGMSRRRCCRSWCPFCSTATPNSIAVTLPTVSANPNFSSCTGCTSFAGAGQTYILTRDYVSSDICLWTYTFVPPLTFSICSTIDYIYVSVETSLGKVILYVGFWLYGGSYGPNLWLTSWIPGSSRPCDWDHYEVPAYADYNSSYSACISDGSAVLTVVD
jgi:hypothetical protein